MKLLTVFGAGILIGTALNVIIPEGLHMWFSALPTEEHHEEHHSEHKHDHSGEEGNWQIGASLAVGFAFMLVVDRISGEFGHTHGGPGLDGIKAAYVVYTPCVLCRRDIIYHMSSHTIIYYYCCCNMQFNTIC
jgi:hypothetical protein